MKLSVLMITYNHERYIRAALDSVLCQAVDFEWEIVVGEDCSTDSTRQILLEYAEKHPARFRLFPREKNMGAVPNFYATLEACRGQYVALLEGDDFWTSPHKLSRQVAFLDQHPDYVCCFHNVIEHDEDGVKADFPYVRADTAEVLLLEDLLSQNLIPTCSAVFRRGLIDPLPAWALQLKMADHPLHILNARHGKTAYLNDLMGVYRVHGGGVWSGLDWLSRLKEDGRLLEFLTHALKGSHRIAARTALARKYWEQVGAYEMQGDRRTARDRALRSLKARVATGTPTVAAKLKTMTRLMLPSLYQAVRQTYGRLARPAIELAAPARSASSNPRVSFVIPAYNAERYLAQAVQSVLAQTVADIECIIVDDGSTDRTPMLIADLARQDARVRPLRIPHGGIVEALNAGVQAARSDLIARMDADDICLPDRLERQLVYLNEHPDCVALGTAIMLVDPFNSTLWKIDVKTDHDQIDAELLRGNGWAMFHPTTLLRRQAVLNVGGYRAQYQWAEDLDLFLRLAEVGRLANLKEPMLRYRQHFASVNRTRLETQLRRTERVVADAYQRRGKSLAPDFKLDSSPPLTRYEQIRAWCERAIMTHNLYAARRHALAVLRFEPLRYDSWALMYHAIAG